MKKSSCATMLVTAFALLILGLILILYPETSLLYLCYITGAIGILFGLIRLIVEWTNTRNIGIRTAYIVSVLALLFGILFIVKAEMIINLACTLMGIVITFDALFKLEAAFRMKSFGVAGWKAYLIVSVVLIAIGLAMIFDPFSGAKFIVIVSGALLMAEALCWFWAVIALRKHFGSTDAAAPQY